jgi:Xaa-Pro aminopeptidase
MFRAALCGFFIIHACIGYAGDRDFFAERRQRLLTRIGDSIAVLPGMPDTRDYVPFRQDNNFYYLTGVDTPGAMLLLDGHRREAVLFLASRDENAESWEGARLYPGTAARNATGLDDAMDFDALGPELDKRIEGVKVLYVPFMPFEAAASSRDRALDYEEERTGNAWDGRESRETAFRDALRDRFGISVSVRDLSPILDAMRQVKDSQELERLRRAAAIGALGIKEAMRSAGPGMLEYQLAAVAEFVYLWHGASGYAFFPIVGSGPNSCMPHYHANGRRMEEGDIVVMDFGPDSGYYASDIARTFPVSGRFSEEQAGVYRVVLEAQKAALGAVRPGATFDDLEDAADKVLRRHGYDKYKKHAIGHYVGMAVHDVGKAEPFQPGTVLAVEPGVYIPEKNLGIRIEDTVAVTETGCEVLTGDVPKEIDEIEKLMSEDSRPVKFSD